MHLFARLGLPQYLLSQDLFTKLTSVIDFVLSVSPFCLTTFVKKHSSVGNKSRAGWYYAASTRNYPISDLNWFMLCYWMKLLSRNCWHGFNSINYWIWDGIMSLLDLIWFLLNCSLSFFFFFLIQTADGYRQRPDPTSNSRPESQQSKHSKMGSHISYHSRQQQQRSRAFTNLSVFPQRDEVTRIH